MNAESRRPEATGSQTLAAASTASIAPGADNPPLRPGDPAEIEKRAGGIVRVTTMREVVAVCIDCGARFDSTGPAWSHSRASRHRVECDYSASFTFAPVELLDRAR